MAYNSEFILIHCNTNMEKKYQNTPSDTCIESDCGTRRRGCIGLHMQTHALTSTIRTSEHIAWE